MSRFFKSVGTVVLAGLIGSAVLAADPAPVPLPSTQAQVFLFRPNDDARHPAIVFMHGCGGLLTQGGAIVSRESDWGRRLVADGYVVLMVDSFSGRGVRQMCSPSTFDRRIYAARVGDAKAALSYLQRMPFVIADRVGLMGWSEGGGVVLRAAGETTGFRAAVTFYPARCSRSQLGAHWRSTMPLFILIGEADVWTPAGPCRALIRTANGGAAIELQTYPGAYHDFDWPNVPIHEITAYRTSAGVVPITGTDPAARADALERVPAYWRLTLKD